MASDGFTLISDIYFILIIEEMIWFQRDVEENNSYS